MAGNGSVVVRVSADTTQFEAAMNRVQNSMDKVRQASMQLSQKMRDAMLSQAKALEDLKVKQLEIQGQWLDMAMSAKNYSGTSEQFIKEVEEMGKAHKKVTDEMMARNELAKMSFIQSVGAMLARSGQSEKIAQNFERMGNPLYMVNNAALKVSGSMERIARQGQPAALALKMLGPKANMKQLNDMTMLISQGLMRFQMVALASAATTAILFNSLHEAAMKNENYAKSFNTMIETLKKAFQPMVDVFTQVMPHVYNFITAIAQMIVKFNKAHPFLAKLIQGFLLLIPLLTFILSPLAIGIGLFNGMIAAFSSIWVLIGPLVTGLAAMSGTVMLVAGVIVGLVAVGVLLYKNWDTVKAKAAEVWNAVKTFFVQAWDAIKAKTSEAWSAVKNVVLNGWESIKNTCSTAASAVGNVLSTAWNAIKSATQTAFNAVKSFVTSIWNRIKSTIQSVVNTVKSVVSAAWNNINSVTSSVLNSVKSTISSIFNGIKSTISSVVNGIKSAVSSAFNAVKSAITKPIDEAKSIISGILDSIKSMFSGLKLTIPKPKIPRITVTKANANVAGVSIPYPKIDVSWYAKGGIFNGPSIIGVGEKGEEAVVPLQGSRMKPFADAIASQIKLPNAQTAYAFGGGDIVITLDGREIARATAPYMDGELRRNRDSKVRARGGF